MTRLTGLSEANIGYRLLHNALAMNYCSNHNLITLQPVDDAVTLGNQLADVLVIEFRNLTAGAWEST